MHNYLLAYGFVHRSPPCRSRLNTEHFPPVENCAIPLEPSDLSTRLGPNVGLEEERVYHVHEWAEVHRLFAREGWSQAEIAEKLC